MRVLSRLRGSLAQRTLPALQLTSVRCGRGPRGTRASRETPLRRATRTLTNLLSVVFDRKKDSGTRRIGEDARAMCGRRGGARAASGSAERAAPDGRSIAIPRGAERGRPRRCSPPLAVTGPAHHSRVRDTDKKKPGHPRGAGSARAVGRTGQRAGRPGPDGGNQLHPVVSPQFSHLWQVPLRTVSQPQRGQGGASGVELSRR